MLSFPFRPAAFAAAAVLACAASLVLATSSAHAVEITMFGTGTVEFYDEDTGDPIAEGVLSIGLVFDLAGATPASPGDPSVYIGAATNPEMNIDVLDLNVFGPGPGPDLFPLPYATSFLGMGSDGTPNDVGDAFVSPFFVGVSFPTNPDGGAPTAVPEPLYIEFSYLGAAPTDLASLVAGLLAVPDPILLFDEVFVDVSLGGLGNPNLEDIRFQIDTINVIPEPSTALLLGLGLVALGRRRAH